MIIITRAGLRASSFFFIISWCKPLTTDSFSFFLFFIFFYEESSINCIQEKTTASTRRVKATQRRLTSDQFSFLV